MTPQVSFLIVSLVIFLINAAAVMAILYISGALFSMVWIVPLLLCLVVFAPLSVFVALYEIKAPPR